MLSRMYCHNIIFRFSDSDANEEEPILRTRKSARAPKPATIQSSDSEKESNDNGEFQFNIVVRIFGCFCIFII